MTATNLDLARESARLVNVEQGLVSRRIFSDPDIYQLELEQVFARCWLYLGHESQLPNPRRLHQCLHGRGARARRPQPPGQDQRLHQHLPPPRQPRLPCGCGQQELVHVHVSRLDVRPGREADRRAGTPGAVPRRAEPRRVGPDPSCAGGQLQGAGLRDVRSGCAVAGRVPGRHAMGP